jgi:hypothetical protein
MPTVTDDALLSIPAVVIVYILLFTLASFEVRQKKIKKYGNKSNNKNSR